jgi:serine/threonine-protein phosphatase 6 regulatory ankyrin repeat subunit B
LHLAAIYKRVTAFNKAAARNLNINLQDEFGNTAFHYAARAGSVEMTSTMVTAKAKKMENNYYQYPIHMAIESKSQETFELLKSEDALM